MDALKSMTADVYSEFQAVLGATSFEGATGPISFIDQGDPKGAPGPDPQGLSVIEQMVNGDPVELTLAGFAGPFGVRWETPELVFTTYDEELSTGAPLEVQEYRTCPVGQALDFSTNACQTCKDGEFPDQGACVPCEAGSFSLAGASECTKCSAGTYQNITGQSGCKICEAGSKSASGAAECELCPPGRFAAESGMAHCDPCGPGTAQASAGARKCEPCPVGHFSAETGETTECQACPAGTFADDGATKCTSCGVGTYSDTSVDACLECPKTFSTLVMGSSSLGGCTCAVGKYWSRANDDCRDCPIGEAFCPGGLDLPVRPRGLPIEKQRGSFLSSAGPGLLASSLWPDGLAPFEKRNSSGCRICVRSSMRSITGGWWTRRVHRSRRTRPLLRRRCRPSSMGLSCLQPG